MDSARTQDSLVLPCHQVTVSEKLQGSRATSMFVIHSVDSINYHVDTTMSHVLVR